MSKKHNTKKSTWTPHKQILVSLRCGVKVEVDKKIANLIRFMNASGVETRHSCQGQSGSQGYVSMFATPQALGLAHYLLDHGSEAKVQIERDIHPNGYENLVFRWPKKNLKTFETLVRKYYSC